jgi:hypothetical protein
MRAAGTERSWMSAFSDRHAYRCLPLTIANAYGWELLCPVSVEVEWNGGDRVEDVHIRPFRGASSASVERFCVSNFSRGIVTFHVDYIFETPAGWGLMVTGPANWPRANATPLTGIVESDWLPYTFTMNYQMHTAGIERWSAGEPYCVVFPIPRLALNDTVPEVRRLEGNVELSARHEDFRRARNDFRARLRSRDPDAIKQAWQRYYFLGRNVDGTSAPQHVSKLRLHEPVDKRSLGAEYLCDEASSGVATPPERRWFKESLLDRIHDGQTPSNVTGRKRIDAAGRLIRSPDTREIVSAADAQGLDILCIESLIQDAECRRLVETFHALRHLVVQHDPTDSFWNDRYLWGRDVAQAHPEDAAIMIDAVRRAIASLKHFYKIHAPLYADLLQLVQWQNGLAMPPHADRANPDGRPHGMAYRDFGGVLYLNDGYAGGELYFTKPNLVVRPRAGMFVGFTGGFHHEHAVVRVESGPLRLTMPMFFTFDARRADALVHPKTGQHVDAARACSARRDPGACGGGASGPA